MSSKDQDQIKTIECFFERRSGIAAVYLFGSRARGRGRPGSDHDVAVLFEPQSVPSLPEMLDMQEDLAAQLGGDVDLVALNRVSPIVKHQIFKFGKLLLKKQPSLINDFFSKSLMEYVELKRVRAPIERNLLKGRIHG